jgi:hypothetical protein
MSLDWRIKDEAFPQKLIWRTNEVTKEEDVQPELHCLIFGTMTLQHSLQGEMTDDVLKEISRRLTLLNAIGAMPTYYCSTDEGKKRHKKIEISIETIIRYWGLYTNVSHLSASKWNAYFMRVSKVNEYEFKYDKEEALKAIKEYPELTEGERVLLQWKAENEAELTTPPPTE